MIAVARHSPLLGIGTFLVSDYIGGVQEAGFHLEVESDDEERKGGDIAIHYRPRSAEGIARDVHAGMPCFVIQDEFPVAITDEIVGDGFVQTVPFNLKRDQIVEELLGFVEAVEGEV